MKTLSSSLEDYLEAIYILKEGKGFTRVSKIAKFLNVKMPSVNSALKILAKKGLIVHENYGYIFLTKKGRTEAKKIYSRHLILKRFLKDILGVSEKKAEIDACKIEHHISKESLNKLLNYIEKIIKNGSVSD
jgi:DtxR family Mn-dependent transcriptional regulator